jgi:hypothetical protein
MDLQRIQTIHQDIIDIVEGLKSLVSSSTELRVAHQVQDEYSVFDIFNDININSSPVTQPTVFTEAGVAAMLEDRHARLLRAVGLTNIVVPRIQ